LRRPSPALSNLAAGTADVMLVLLALQQSLRLPAAWGVEDWLGWRDAASVVAAVEGWCRRPQGLVPAAAYFVIDQILFVPLYAVLSLRVAEALRQALAGGLSRRGERLQPAAGARACGCCWACWCWPTRWRTPSACTTWAGPGGARRWPWRAHWRVAARLGPGVLPAPAWLQRSGPWVGGVALAAGLGLAALASAACTDPTDPVTAATAAHRLKQGLTAAVLLLPLVGAGAWWLGVEFDPARQRRERDDRATLRALAAGVVGRSRYVLLILAAYGALTLGMDQCRDVMLALADVSTWAPRSGPCGCPCCWPGRWRRPLFAHSCWLWARLAGMVQRPGVVVPEDAGRAAGGGPVCAALGPCAGRGALADAVRAGGLHAGRPGAGVGKRATLRLSARRAAAGLCGRGAGGGRSCCCCSARRRAQHDDVASYYNSESDLWSLLWFHSGRLSRTALGTGLVRPTAAAPGWRRWSRGPWLLPVLALLGHGWRCVC
jgi:hypothetical protein